MREDYIDERKPARRFELATESIARSRLDNFRDTVKRFQQQHSEVLGATVFGSMIRGEKAKATSDVDAFLYVDADALTDADKTKEVRNLENQYRSDLLKELGASEEEAKELYRDLIPKLLSSEILDQNIQNNIDYENKYDALQKKRRETDTTKMTKEDVDELYSQGPPENKAIDNFEVGGMFHARVGAGIKKYRKLFLEKLVALPNQEMAERIWKGVYAQISTMEAGDKKRKMPRTLKEALQTYHPDLYKEKLISEFRLLLRTAQSKDILGVHERILEKDDELKEKYGENRRSYRMWHLLVSSTPDISIEKFDFPNEDSIEKFIRALV